MIVGDSAAASAESSGADASVGFADGPAIWAADMGVAVVVEARVKLDAETQTLKASRKQAAGF